MVGSLFLLLMTVSGMHCCAAAAAGGGLERASGGRRLQAGEIADLPNEVKDEITLLLLKEFGNETDSNSASASAGFNATMKSDASQIETVVRISASGESGSSGGSSPADASSTASSASAASKEEPISAAEALQEVTMERSVDRIIDRHDNTFILSKPGEDVASLTLDAQLVTDVTVVLVAASVFGACFEAVKQPTINGYLVAGAVVGPGGLNLIKELVQVESLAQIGVSLLLFGLGMELNLGKLTSMWRVTLVGGALQILLFMFIGGGVAVFVETNPLQGVFIGALVSMSSTSVVVKCLESTKSTTTVFGAITIGTLLLQDCSVGLLFALLPVFKPAPEDTESNDDEAAEVNTVIMLLILRMLFKLTVAIITGMFISQYFLCRVLRLLRTHASPELCQLAMVSFCLAGAWTFAKFGLSDELGAFSAGLMVSVANAYGGVEDEHLNLAWHSIESLHNVMAALFVASTALIISPRFLGQHFIILTISTLVLMLVKGGLITAVVAAFGYDTRTSLAVGISMAHLGEFSIILLSLGRELKILSVPVYMLLLGIAALSLIATPFLIKGLSAIVGETVQQHETLPTDDCADALESPHHSAALHGGTPQAERKDSAPEFMLPAFEIQNGQQGVDPAHRGSTPQNSSSTAGKKGMTADDSNRKSFSAGVSTALFVLAGYRLGATTSRKH